MKALVWIAVILIVVPVQVTWLQYVAIGDVRPDVCLALTALIGFLRDERQGFLFGLGIGFAQDLSSAGELWLNMLTKGAAGLVSALVGRRLVRTTVLAFVVLVLSVSALSGILFLFSGRAIGSLADEVLTVRSVLLPQASYDSAVAAGLYWLLARRIGTGEETEAAATGTASILSVK